ncbi:MAG TPA: hypothetical protein VG939_07020 [Caulobacteraceae bacterium]|nr:hypothetical protein [Caulobacteraceae bacterium]
MDDDRLEIMGRRLRPEREPSGALALEARALDGQAAEVILPQALFQPLLRAASAALAGASAEDGALSVTVGRVTRTEAGLKVEAGALGEVELRLTERQWMTLARLAVEALTPPAG